jgi:hypothetical protein
MLWGGLFLGLAIMSKTITAIAVAVILLSFAARIFQSKNLTISKQIKLIVTVGFCAMAPFLLFELVKIISLGWERYLELQIVTIEHYKHNAILITSEENHGRVSSHSVESQFIWFYNFLQSAWSIFLPFTVYISYLVYKKKNRENSHIVFAGMILILCFLVHAAWWIRLAPPFNNRYLVEAFFYYFSGLFLLLVNIDYKKESRFQTSAIFIFLFLLFAGRGKEIDYFLSPGFERSGQKLQEQLIVSDAVKNLEQQGVTMISCGNNFELEYLLPRSRNFKKCEEILDHSLGDKVMLVIYFVAPTLTLEIGNGEHYGAFNQIPSEISSRCNHEYLSTEKYSLNWCR